MRTNVIKSFKIGDKVYNKGDMLELKLSTFLKLKEIGVVEPIIPNDALKLNRNCVVCKSDAWKKVKPTGNTLIICLICGHSELYFEERKRFNELIKG